MRVSDWASSRSPSGVFRSVFECVRSFWHSSSACVSMGESELRVLVATRWEDLPLTAHRSPTSSKQAQDGSCQTRPGPGQRRGGTKGACARPPAPRLVKADRLILDSCSSQPDVQKIKITVRFGADRDGALRFATRVGRGTFESTDPSSWPCSCPCARADLQINVKPHTPFSKIYRVRSHPSSQS